MQYLNENDYFHTSEFYLVAFLRFINYPIEATEKDSDGRITFIIPRDGDLDNAIQQYWSKEASVDPLGFGNAIKEVKSWIHSS